MTPPYPLWGVVSWNVNTSCNYRCTYCTQRFVDDRAQRARDLPGFLRFFAGLPGDWEVKLSGGEPTLHPGFLDLVAALAEQGRKVSLVTNFSAPDATLDRFAALTAARPGVVSASLHLEYAEPEAFRAKVARFAAVYPGAVNVTCVATRASLPHLPALRERFAPLAFKVQPEKQDRDVIAYTPAERDALLALGGHGGTGRIDPDFSGRACWAGARYFVLDHVGEAWRCYPARRYRKERLGNVLDGTFRLPRGAAPCPYRYCNCTVPQERGMIDLEAPCSPAASA